MPKVSTPKVRINLKKKSSVHTEGYLFLTFRWDGNKVVYPLNQYLSGTFAIEEKYWDAKRYVLKTIGKNSKKIEEHREVNRMLKQLSEYVEDFYSNKPKITESSLKRELDYFTGKKKRPSPSGKVEKHTPLFKFIDEFIVENQEHGKRGTWKKFITVSNHLLSYQKEKGINLTYEKLDWKFRSEFLSWLYAPPRNHATNNASKIFEVLQQFLQESYKLEYHQNDIFRQKGFGVKRAKTNNKTVFSFAELDKIRKLDLSNNPRLDKVRDLFIVGCYTGLRFSDWHKVSKENIILLDKNEILEIHTRKTNTDVYIPSTPELREVLKKYDYKLPSITAQKFNDYIKEIIQMTLPDATTKITTSVAGKTDVQIVPKYSVTSSHCARRSFATNFFEMGIPAPILMQITGHSTQKQFFDYVDADKKKLAAQFAQLVRDYSNPKNN